MQKIPGKNSRYKTYRCNNDECSYYLKHDRKRRKTLFKGVLGADSWVIDRCPSCNEDIHVGEEKKEDVDNKPVDALKYLRTHNADD
jgi:hypothetical protein